MAISNTSLSSTVDQSSGRQALISSRGFSLAAQREPIDTRPISQEQQDKLNDERGNLVFGNPQGNQVVHVMTDFNCGHCRNELKDLLLMTETNPDLKVVIENYPILGRPSDTYDGRTASQDAALAAAAIAEGPELTPQQTRSLIEGIANSERRLDYNEMMLIYGRDSVAGAKNLFRVVDLFPLPTRAQRLMPFVEADKTMGREMGITGTPAVIYDGQILNQRSQLPQMLEEKRQRNLQNIQNNMSFGGLS